MIIHGHEIANALTMIPFAYLSYVAAHPMLSITITGIWVCAFIYHTLVSIGKYAHGFIFFAGDCFFQVASLTTLVYVSQIYPKRIKEIALGIGAVLLATLVYLGSNGIRTNRIPMTAIVCTSHIAHAILAYFFVKDIANYKYALLFFALVVLAYIQCDIFNYEYSWSIGHVLCAAYTYYFWKALGVVRIS